MKKRKMNDRLLAVIICICMLVGGITFTNYNTKVSAGTGTDVTGKLRNVNITLQNTNGNSIIKDNVVESGAALVFNTNYDLMVSWEIPQSEFEGEVHEGDYLTIDIGNDYFTYADTSLDNQLIYEGVVIGKWGIKDNNIIYTFSENAESSLKVSGYFVVSGYFSSKAVGTNVINIAGIPVNIDTNPEITGFPYSENSTLYADEALIKFGTNIKGSDTIYWDIVSNLTSSSIYYFTKMENSPVQDVTKSNMIISDELPDDLVVDNIAIQVPIFRPKSEKYLSDEVGGKIDITSQFTMVNQDSKSYNDWIEALKSQTPAYGSSNNGKTVIVSVGDLPGSLLLEDNPTDFGNSLKEMNFALTADEIEALKNIYSEEGKYPVRYVDVVIASKAISGVFEKESYINTAEVITDGESPIIAQSPILSIEDIGGGIQIVTPKTAKLIKKDADTGDVIEGAKFKLQYLDGVIWEDYKTNGNTLIKATDEDGQLEFDSLPPAVYRFVEVEAKEGYDINSTQYSINEFEIKDTDTAGKNITAKNTLLPITISGEKTWEDNNDVAKQRPTSIIVRLMNGSNEVGYKEVSEVDDWKYSFTNIPVYDENHNKIVYTITEDTVTDYRTSISGFNITNSYKYTSYKEQYYVEAKDPIGSYIEIDGKKYELKEENLVKSVELNSSGTIQDKSQSDVYKEYDLKDSSAQYPWTVAKVADDGSTIVYQIFEKKVKEETTTTEEKTTEEKTTEEITTEEITTEAITKENITTAESITKEDATTKEEVITKENTTTKEKVRSSEKITAIKDKVETQGSSSTLKNQNTYDEKETMNTSDKVKTGDNSKMDVFIFLTLTTAVISGILFGKKRCK